MRTELPNSLRNLTTLRLDLDVFDERKHKHRLSALEPTAGIMELNHSIFVQQFLSSASNLVRLRLGTLSRQASGCIDDQFMSWLAQRPGTSPPGPTWGSNPQVTPSHFPFLTVLVMENFTVSLDNLKGLVVKVGPTLRRLRLGSFTLVCPEDVPHNTDSPAGWSSVFRLLACNSNLESFQLTGLLSSYPRFGTTRYYKACCHEVPCLPGMRRLLGLHGLKSCVNVSYAGHDMAGFLENLASNMTEAPSSQTHQHDFDNLDTDPREMSDCETDICDEDSSADGDFKGENDQEDDDDEEGGSDEEDEEENDDNETDSDEDTVGFTEDNLRDYCWNFYGVDIKINPSFVQLLEELRGEL